MAEFIMLVGLSGSTKSTYAELLAKRNGYKVVSSDAIRAEVFGDENDQTHNAQVFEEMKRRTIAFLKKDESVIYDATNLNSKKRKALLSQLPSKILKTAIVVLTPVEQCIKNAAARDRKVSAEVIEKQHASFQVPLISEGWDDITYYETEWCRTTEQKKEYVKYLREQNNVPHDNPHHKGTTCQEHCDRVFEGMVAYCKENKSHLYYNDEVILKTAAAMHDCAKFRTRTRWTGEKDDGYMHYPKHANTSAYDYLVCTDIIDSNVAILINYHMSLFNIQDERVLAKKIGLANLDLLKILNKIDKENP